MFMNRIFAKSFKLELGFFEIVTVVATVRISMKYQKNYVAKLTVINVKIA